MKSVTMLVKAMLLMLTLVPVSAFAMKLDVNNDQRFFEYGIESAKALDDWITQFITDVKNKDITTVSKKISFPVKVFLDGSTTRIKSRKKFEQKFDDIFNDRIIRALGCYHIHHIKVNWFGAKIGQGELLVFPRYIAETDEIQLKVSSINNSPMFDKTQDDDACAWKRKS